jgi:hypothetical protein
VNKIHDPDNQIESIIITHGSKGDIASLRFKDSKHDKELSTVQPGYIYLMIESHVFKALGVWT